VSHLHEEYPRSSVDHEAFCAVSIAEQWLREIVDQWRGAAHTLARCNVLWEPSERLLMGNKSFINNKIQMQFAEL
jgi:hypothetical protein